MIPKRNVDEEDELLFLDMIGDLEEDTITEQQWIICEECKIYGQCHFINKGERYKCPKLNDDLEKDKL